MPWIKTMAAKLIAPGVYAHSIIPVTGGTIIEGANDGVVAYEIVVKGRHRRGTTLR